jgi:diguanylate cyclase (GGDEF)-like protein
MLEKSRLVLEPGFKYREESSCAVRTRLLEKFSHLTREPLLYEANQELALLLHDYRNLPPPASESSAQAECLHHLLSRAVQCALKQNALQQELLTGSFTDELTGLYNRRGFMRLAEQQLKLAGRTQCGFTLFFIDVDGLKQINDTFGHPTGDSALICTAEALSATFRDSDILARLGGDEFAALAIESSGDHESAIASRLSEKLKFVNSHESRYLLSLSVGAVRFDPKVPSSLVELINLADQAMYRAKKDRHLHQPDVSSTPSVGGKVIELSRRSSTRRARKRNEQRPVSVA